VLQRFLDAVTAGDAVVPIDHVYGFDQIAEPHAAMEAGEASGKLFVTTCVRGGLAIDQLDWKSSTPSSMRLVSSRLVALWF
jgi:hypothetical protein